MKALWPLFSSLLLAISCSGIITPTHHRGCPVEPVARSELPENLSFRARMRMGIRNDEVSFEVIARATPEAIAIVGIAPYGMRLFEARQFDGYFSVLSSASVEARILALYAGDALNRTYWIRAPTNSSSWDRTGERIIEKQENGERRRTYRRIDQPSGSRPVVIDYARNTRPEVAPDARIENPWCDYWAVIVPFNMNHGNSGS